MSTKKIGYNKYKINKKSLIKRKIMGGSKSTNIPYVDPIPDNLDPIQVGIKNNKKNPTLSKKILIPKPIYASDISVGGSFQVEQSKIPNTTSTLFPNVLDKYTDFNNFSEYGEIRPIPLDKIYYHGLNPSINRNIPLEKTISKSDKIESKIKKKSLSEFEPMIQNQFLELQTKLDNEGKRKFNNSILTLLNMPNYIILITKFIKSQYNDKIDSKITNNLSKPKSIAAYGGGNCESEIKSQSSHNLLKILDSIHDFASDRGKLNINTILKGFTDEENIESWESFFKDTGITKDNVEHKFLQHTEDIILKFRTALGLKDSDEIEDDRLFNNFLIPTNIEKDNVNLSSEFISLDEHKSLDDDGKFFLYKLENKKTTFKKGDDENYINFIKQIKNIVNSKFSANRSIIYEAAKYNEVITHLINNENTATGDKEFLNNFYLDDYQPLDLLYADSSIWDSATGKGKKMGAVADDNETGDITNCVSNPLKCLQLLYLKGLYDEHAFVDYQGENSEEKLLKHQGYLVKTGPPVSSLSKVKNLKHVNNLSSFSRLFDKKEQKLLPKKSVDKKDSLGQKPKGLCHALTIKRSGDWGQVEFCKKYNIILYTFDRLCALYAVYRNCPCIFEVSLHDSYYILVFTGKTKIKDGCLNILKNINKSQLTFIDNYNKLQKIKSEIETAKDLNFGTDFIEELDAEFKTGKIILEFQSHYYEVLNSKTNPSLDKTLVSNNTNISSNSYYKIDKTNDKLPPKKIKKYEDLLTSIAKLDDNSKELRNLLDILNLIKIDFNRLISSQIDKNKLFYNIELFFKSLFSENNMINNIIKTYIEYKFSLSNNDKLKINLINILIDKVLVCINQCEKCEGDFKKVEKEASILSKIKNIFKSDTNNNLIRLKNIYNKKIDLIISMTNGDIGERIRQLLCVLLNYDNNAHSLINRNYNSKERIQCYLKYSLTNKAIQKKYPYPRGDEKINNDDSLNVENKYIYDDSKGYIALSVYAEMKKKFISFILDEKKDYGVNIDKLYCFLSNFQRFELVLINNKYINKLDILIYLIQSIENVLKINNINFTILPEIETLLKSKLTGKKLNGIELIPPSKYILLNLSGILIEQQVHLLKERSLIVYFKYGQLPDGSEKSNLKTKLDMISTFVSYFFDILYKSSEYTTNFPKNYLNNYFKTTKIDYDKLKDSYSFKENYNFCQEGGAKAEDKSWKCNYGEEPYHIYDKEKDRCNFKSTGFHKNGIFITKSDIDECRTNGNSWTIADSKNFLNNFFNFTDTVRDDGKKIKASGYKKIIKDKCSEKISQTKFEENNSSQNECPRDRCLLVKDDESIDWDKCGSGGKTKTKWIKDDSIKFINEYFTEEQQAELEPDKLPSKKLQKIIENWCEDDTELESKSYECPRERCLLVDEENSINWRKCGTGGKSGTKWTNKDSKKFIKDYFSEDETENVNSKAKSEELKLIIENWCESDLYDCESKTDEDCMGNCELISTRDGNKCKSIELDINEEYEDIDADELDSIQTDVPDPEHIKKISEIKNKLKSKKIGSPVPEDEVPINVNKEQKIKKKLDKISFNITILLDDTSQNNLYSEYDTLNFISNQIVIDKNNTNSNEIPEESSEYVHILTPIGIIMYSDSCQNMYYQFVKYIFGSYMIHNIPRTLSIDKFMEISKIETFYNQLYFLAKISHQILIGIIISLGYNTNKKFTDKLESLFQDLKEYVYLVENKWLLIDNILNHRDAVTSTDNDYINLYYLVFNQLYYNLINNDLTSKLESEFKVSNLNEFINPTLVDEIVYNDSFYTQFYNYINLKFDSTNKLKNFIQNIFEFKIDYNFRKNSNTKILPYYNNTGIDTSNQLFTILFSPFLLEEVNEDVIKESTEKSCVNTKDGTHIKECSNWVCGFENNFTDIITDAGSKDVKLDMTDDKFNLFKFQWIKMLLIDRTKIYNRLQFFNLILRVSKNDKTRELNETEWSNFKNILHIILKNNDGIEIWDKKNILQNIFKYIHLIFGPTTNANLSLIKLISIFKMKSSTPYKIVETYFNNIKILEELLDTFIDDLSNLQLKNSKFKPLETQQLKIVFETFRNIILSYKKELQSFLLLDFFQDVFTEKDDSTFDLPKLLNVLPDIEDKDDLPLDFIKNIYQEGGFKKSKKKTIIKNKSKKRSRIYKY